MNYLRSLLIGSASLIACTLVSSTSTWAETKVNAVASFSILGDMVSRIGGNLVQVTTIVGANADTHVYEPKPADAVAVSHTQIFFVNGLGFEGWMDRFVQSTAFKGTIVTASAGVKTRKMEEDGQEITDPHAWQNLSNGLLYVKNIAAARKPHMRVEAAVDQDVVAHDAAKALAQLQPTGQQQVLLDEVV